MLFGLSDVFQLTSRQIINTSAGPLRPRNASNARGPWARLLAALIFCAVLIPAAAVIPAAAQAAPITYAVTGGIVNLTVFNGAVPIGSTVSTTLSGSVTIDMVAESLDSINIVLEPNIGLTLSTPYGGFDQITIESASLGVAPGYSSTTIASAPSSFTVSGGPLSVNGSYGGSDSSLVNPTVTGIPITYSVPSITAVVNSSPSIELNGVTLNALSGAAFGELSDLTVLANILVTDLVVIPEPSTALLASLGLGLLAAVSRRRSD